MDFRLHFEKAWQVFTAHLAPLLLSTLVLTVITMVTFGIMAPVCMAGYMQSLLLALRDGRRPEVRDLFSHMRLFFPLLGFSIVLVLLIYAGFALLVVPGIIVVLAISFGLIYMLPLMTDRSMGLVDAARESIRMAMEPPLAEQLAVVAVYLVLNSIGNSTGIGLLFTQPYGTLFVLSVYEVKRRRLLTGPGTPPTPPSP
ncbi:hypothetical protein ACLG6S_07320 [Thermodesulfobacteriota bacterium B35]